MRVFIIGATGSIGSEVTKALRGRGHEVVGLVRSSQSARKLEQLGGRPVLGDMRQPEGWKREAAAADGLIHHGAIVFRRRGGRSWLRTATAANVAAGRGLVAAATAGGKCRALIMNSGAYVVGDHGDAWVDEDTPPTPNAMAALWLANEATAEAARRLGLAAVSLRVGSVYASTGTFARAFLTPAAAGQFRYPGGGENFFPFVALEDVADAFVRAVEDPPTAKVLNVVDDDPLRMREFATLLLRAFDRRARGMPVWLATVVAGRPLADVLAGSYRARNASAKALLGWKPTSPTFRERIEEIVAGYKRLTVKDVRATER